MSAEPLHTVNGTARLYLGDCVEVMRSLPDDSVDLIATDPPYFKVVGEAWDRQWDKPAAFLHWLRVVLAEFQRVLKPNGSLYLFASPRMAARVECAVGEVFAVLNHVTWAKALGDYPPGDHRATAFRARDVSASRSFMPFSERIIFAEQAGAEGWALGESGYLRACDKARAFVFEPLRAYLDGERERAGWSKPQVDAAWCRLKGVSQTAQSQKWFSGSCWNLPTRDAYEWLRALFNSRGGEYLRKDYEDLRKDYEDLKREHAELRRPFSVSADVPFTDVWSFRTEPSGTPDRHPCQKPLDLMEHIVRSSSRPGAVVLDAFMGSGSTGVAAANLGRRFIGIEREPEYLEIARRRIAHWSGHPVVEGHAPAPEPREPEAPPEWDGQQATVWSVAGD